MGASCEASFKSLFFVHLELARLRLLYCFGRHVFCFPFLLFHIRKKHAAIEAFENENYSRKENC